MLVGFAIDPSAAIAVVQVGVLQQSRLWETRKKDEVVFQGRNLDLSAERRGCFVMETV